MLHPVTVRTLALAACGWLLACEASALTLGRARGAALIGRPLELVIPVTLDASDTQGPCAGADLFYGEERVRAPIVRWEPGIGMQGVLRVTSSVPVDEPMVTLYLRAGCGQSSTRRFVLLSELATEVEPARAAPLAALAPVVPGSAAAAPAANPAPSTTPRRAPAAGAPGAVPPRRAPAPSARQRAVRQDAAPARPRLTLEPLDLIVEREPALRLTSEIRTEVAADPGERQAAAALWQMLQKSPDERLQEALRLQAAERELASLRAATQRDAAALVEMRGHVERSQRGSRTASLLVLALATVLAALLAWLVLRWHRVRRLERVGRWFDVHGEAALRSEAVTTPGPPAAPVAAATAPSAPGVTAAPTPIAEATAAAVPMSEAFQARRGESLRLVGVGELIDVHDKADFFLSIGEAEQAISLLESHVHDHVETGALAWMDLLELYHSLGRRADYARLRGEFRQRFAAHVPDFEHFDQPSASLENYGRALSRIVALWPSPRVLEVIEESIFRKPGVPGGEPFSLEAYRELVLLYHVAIEMALPQQEAPREADETESGFPETSLQPLNALDRPDPAPADQERLMIPPASPRLGVDIDLEELPGADTELSALDFDVSAYDDVTDITVAEPPRKRG